MKAVWALDIGGTHLRAGWFPAAVSTKDGSVSRVIPVKKAAWSGRTAESDLQDLEAMLSDCLTEWGPPQAVGVSIAAMLSPDQSRVVSWPNRPWWQDVDLADRLKRLVGAPVRLEDDAAAAVLGECVAGAAQGRADVFMVTVGTGIGGGVVSGGRLLRGAHGWAGDFGHLRMTTTGPRCSCGRIGCLQAWASGPALLRAAQESTEAARLSPDAIFAAIRKREPWTRAAVDQAVGWLALGIANVVRLLDPEIVVIGGGVAQSIPAFAEMLQEAVHQELGAHPAKNIEVVLSNLGDDAGLYGAFSLHFEDKWRNP